MRRFPAPWLVVGALLWPFGLDARQETPVQDEAQPFVETVEVNVVNVEVAVTDKNGDHVGGLTRDDFEIYEDGREVLVTNFYTRGAEPQAAVGGPTDAPTEERPPASGAARRQPLPTLPADQRLHLVVYVDNFNIRPLDRNRVLSKVRSFLQEHLAPEDLVMLVSYDRTLKVERPFTTDVASISQLLIDMESTTGHALLADAERRDLLNEIENTDRTESSSLIYRIRQYAQSIDNDLGFTIDALKSLIGPLSGLPGRKAILHVSGGFPMIPAHDLFYAVQQRSDDISILGETSAFDASRRFEELAAVANANRVTFYAIDASGLRAYGADAIERRGGGWQTLGPELDSMHFANLQSPIRFLADATGGLAVVNTNDVGPGLERIGRDFSSYYSLGFRPARPADGRFHKIEVRVKRKGLVVRHREGYRANSVETQMSDGTASALLYGVDDNPIEVGLEVGRQQRREDGNYLVTLLVRVPFDQIALVPQGEQYRAEVRLFVSAMDSDGGMSPVERQTIPIRIPKEHFEAALRESLVYEAQLLMRGGTHKVAVGLRDDLGRTSSFVSRYVTVGEGSTG